VESCRIFEMGCKEVISVSDGTRLGYVQDVEIQLETGKVSAIVIPGRLRLLGLLGREQDVVIPWEKIQRVGDDIILVDYRPVVFRNKRKEWRIY